MNVSRILRPGLSAVCALLVLMGCQQLPGTRTEQTTVGGGAAGAAAGAALAENDLIGALLGGAAGAAGGYLIGARTDWFDQSQGDRSTAAQEAIEDARQSPATAEDVADAETADLDNDGFVTMDEFIAMEEAGLTGSEILNRLEATGQVFQLSEAQEDRLVDAGLSRWVVAQVEEINREARDDLLGADSEVISQRTT